jgi:hypothetical protein
MNILVQINFVFIPMVNSQLFQVNSRKNLSILKMRVLTKEWYQFISLLSTLQYFVRVMGFPPTLLHLKINWVKSIDVSKVWLKNRSAEYLDNNLYF